MSWSCQRKIVGSEEKDLIVGSEGNKDIIDVFVAESIPPVGRLLNTLCNIEANEDFGDPAWSSMKGIGAGPSVDHLSLLEKLLLFSSLNL